MFFLHFLAINLHVRFAFFFTLDLQHVLEGQLFCMFFAFFLQICNFRAEPLGKLENTIKPRKIAKKNANNLQKKAKQANATKTRKKTCVLHFACKLLAFFANFLVFFYFSSFPRGPARKLQMCEKMQKQNVLPGHAANPTRKKCRKKTNSKCKMNPPYKKCKPKLQKKTKTNLPQSLPGTRSHEIKPYRDTFRRCD